MQYLYFAVQAASTGNQRVHTKITHKKTEKMGNDQLKKEALKLG